MVARKLATGLFMPNLMHTGYVWLRGGRYLRTGMRALRHRRLSAEVLDATAIVGGDALINEATMTGESLAVHKSNGNTVFAGTVIETGEVDICVRTLSDDSRIAKIIQLIDTGEDAKAHIQGKAERLADGIVPISFGLFLTTLQSVEIAKKV